MHSRVCACRADYKFGFLLLHIPGFYSFPFPVLSYTVICVCHIFRSTPPSRLNKVVLKCPSARPYVRMSVRPSVHKKFIWFQWKLVCRKRSMGDAWRYVVWPDPIQCQGNEPLKVGNLAIFKGISSPIYNGGWQMTTESKIMAQYLESLPGPDIWFLTQFLCHVTLKLTVSRSRPPVPYGATL